MNQRGSTLSPASPLGAVGEPSPTTMTCLLCEGSGERRGWETCPECAGRCEVQVSKDRGEPTVGLLGKWGALVPGAQAGLHVRDPQIAGIGGQRARTITDIQLPPGASRMRTEQVAAQIEAHNAEEPGVGNTTVILGFRAPARWPA